MERLYKLYRRSNGCFYKEEVGTGNRKSLKTRDRVEAESLVADANRAANNSEFAKASAEVYLKQAEPELFSRTWQAVMDEIASRPQLRQSSREKKELEFFSKSFDAIRDKVVCSTQRSDFLEVISSGKISISNCVRHLQNYALDAGYLISKIAPKNDFLKSSGNKTKRAISEEEHRRVVSAEGNAERRCYYEMLWITGASQADCANFRAEDFSLELGELVYARKKNGNYSGLKIFSRLEALLAGLPKKGYLFPTLQPVGQKYRGAEFARRCKILNISGISLHSYRYSWAERAYEQGLSEREAMAGLGHSTKAIHRCYSKGARPVCRKEVE